MGCKKVFVFFTISARLAVMPFGWVARCAPGPWTVTLRVVIEAARAHFGFPPRIQNSDRSTLHWSRNMKSRAARFLGLVVLTAIALTVAPQHAGAATISFQEGVSPTGAYTHDAVYIRASEAGTNQNGDPDRELIVGFTNDNSELRGLLGVRRQRHWGPRHDRLGLARLADRWRT